MMTKTRSLFVSRSALWRIVWLTVAACCVAGAQAASQEVQVPKADANLLKQLREGGLVIYIRHSATETSGVAEANGVDVSRCDTQRSLTPAGKAQAKALGRAFSTLHVPVGEVLSSPFCRCKETAELAFGHYKVNPDLYFAIDADAQQTKLFSEKLRVMLSSPPKGGTNRVIISHTANLKEAAGIWPKPEGVAIVFRPKADGTFEPIARVLPDEWLGLAQKQTSARKTQ
jgi:phosphohistidine phosphatase SixA